MAYTHCSKCGQEWLEEEVPAIKVNQGTVGESIVHGCPNCGTDKYLMDTCEPISTETTASK